MSASESGAGSQTGGSGGPPKRSKAQNVINNVVTGVENYVKGGGMLGAGIRAVGRYNEKNNPRSNTNDPTGLYAEGLTTGSRNNNNINGGDGGNDDAMATTQVARNVGGKIIVSPTTAEVSQSSTTDAAAYDNRKTKAKGRSMTIRTNSRGIGKNTNTVLGTKSLLGS